MATVAAGKLAQLSLIRPQGLPASTSSAQIPPGDPATEQRFPEDVVSNVSSDSPDLPTQPSARSTQHLLPTPGVTTSGHSAGQLRVLLAEDGPDNQQVILFYLRRAGFEAEVAENGRVACQMALAAQDAGKPFDVILMDMAMPELDGYAATQELRRGGYARPVVALTAQALTEDREKCMQAGCNDYLTKPINQAELVKVVRQHAQLAQPD